MNVYDRNNRFYRDYYLYKKGKDEFDNDISGILEIAIIIWVIVKIAELFSG